MDPQLNPTFRWRNFRGFQDTGQFEFRPLTLLIGGNNSGKTSLLAPLLLMKQTIESMNASSGLVTKGKLLNAGLYRDFVFQHNIRNRISFDIGFHRHDPETHESSGDVGQEPPGRLAVTFDTTDGSHVSVEQYRVWDCIDRPMLVRRRLESGRYSLSGLGPYRRENPPNETEVRIRRAIRASRPQNFLFRGYDAWAEAMLGHSEDEEGLELSEFVTLYLRCVDFVGSEIRSLLGELFYVGPLREPPRRFYEVDGDVSYEVGIRGEAAPQMILGQSAREATQMNRWLRRFGFDGRLEAEYLTDDAFQLSMVRKGDVTSTNFADTGFGLSQVLPLIVQGIHGPDDSMIVAEQPEIHLNPKLQCALADLFVDIAKGGKRIVVETHSEHLLLRVRQLIAEGQIHSESVALLFVEKAGGISSLRQVAIDELGNIARAEWPQGFFEESLTLALGLAHSQRKAALGRLSTRH